MPGRSTLILCDICGSEVPDRASKEVIYQTNSVRYRFELCPACLDREMKRHGGRRGVPGFRKRAAIVVDIDSPSGLPRQPASS
ncbi:MAG: hypothetical protein M3280_12620 [Actinomycetota bacterium]|nr:hypothetical protein [Actinomycetota bacterium]